MSERHWQRPAVAATALALLAAATVAGCGNSASTSQASTTQTAGVAAATGHKSFTAAQLKRALLTRVGGARPAAPAEAGDYGAMPAVRTSQQTMHGLKVTPAKCAGATMAAFSSSAFGHAPASVATFRVGRDGVSEVLVAATPAIATAALENKLPAGCSHYTATVNGKTFRYSVKEVPFSGLAHQARALNVKATGYAEVTVWSVVYRADGFVGAVTIVGPDASKAGVENLARQAYAYAAQSLS